MGSTSIPEVDVLLVGAGFGAFTMLNKYVVIAERSPLGLTENQDPQIGSELQDL